VNDEMLDELKRAERGDLASNLGAPMANAIAQHAGCKAYIVDPVSVDEWEPIARLSGTPLIERPCLSHALNTKATAKRYARDHEKRYEDLRLVVAHIGSGNTVSAHRDGRMIDATNSREEGAFSALRAGALPAIKLIELCDTGEMSAKELERALVAEGGLKAYLGTSDLTEVEKRIDNSDEKAALVFDAMAYQIAKDIGAMATVLNGEVDAVLITGGMAFSARLTKAICERVEFVAPVHFYPGEDELQALAEGALRVLTGEEKAREYGARATAML
jgi:butyrate kinase